MKVADIPVVFLSYDEPWADEFYADLLSKAPGAQRVHGVKGLDACHKAAAEKAGAQWFITVDADTLVDPAFFDVTIPPEYLNERCRIEWASRNAVNGLSYGNGSVKVWPRSLVRDMRTHEAAPKGVYSVDHEIGRNRETNSGGYGIQLPEIYSTTHPAETPLHGFRWGYREGIRLSTPHEHSFRGRGFMDHLTYPQLRRLRVCCSVGGHAPNGDWMIYGARLGVLANHLGDWDRNNINDFDWFNRLWTDTVLPRLNGRSGTSRYSDITWDVDALRAESDGVAQRIQDELGFEIVSPQAEVSRFVAEHIEEARSPSVVDAMGFMYLKGQYLPKDPETARRMFDVGTILNLSASYNNIARMQHLGQGGPVDLAAAQQNYEIAITKDNRFAPFHLATLLAETDPPTPALTARIDALVDLSKERGFDPPDPVPQPRCDT